MTEAGHKLTATVEIDEMYIGGRTNNPNKWKKHAPVIGMRERGGHLHLIPADQVNQKTVYDIIARNVDKTVDVIMTDESKVYNFDTTQFRGKHRTVNHKTEEYVRYEKGMRVTTNTVESAFSSSTALWGRGISIGQASPGYLQEMTWRFNNRKNAYLFRDSMLKLIPSDNLEY
jgi:hypothetical protein